MDIDNLKKILLFNKHFCHISSELLYAFDATHTTIKLSSWIKEQAFKQFGFMLRDANGIKDFDLILKENYYASKGDWLSEKMRLVIQGKAD